PSCETALVPAAVTRRKNQLGFSLPLTVPASCEYLSAPSSADLPLARRKSTALHSGSCRNADTVPYNLPGKSISAGAPATLARAKHLPAADLCPDSSQFPPRSRSPRAPLCRHRLPVDGRADQSCSPPAAPPVQGNEHRELPDWSRAPRSTVCPQSFRACRV